MELMCLSNFSLTLSHAFMPIFEQAPISPLSVAMTTMSKAFDDSAFGSKPPPSYDTISSTSVPEDSVWRKRSLFSFPQSKQKRRATALARIREIVSYPNFTPSSVESIVNSCASTLPAVDFSDLLQKLNIEDHTALYWAILNNRRDALWAFYKFISEFSPDCTCDLRRACMKVSDHDLFMQLNLGFVHTEDYSLRRMLGCPPDKVDVFQHGIPKNEINCLFDDILDKDYFYVHVVFRMFQKRLRVAETLAVEFVARGRIWALIFYMGSDGKWHVQYRLSDRSSPVPHPKAVLGIMDHGGPPDSRCVENMEPLLALHMGLPSLTLVADQSSHLYTHIDASKSTRAVFNQLEDWPMDNDTAYVDCDGTLRVGLAMMMT